MPLIKSHSNYVLKSKHQTINDGTIWERDITTIGGLNQFAPGQTPIYKSSNFIITVRDDRRTSNQYNTNKWEKGLSGDVWTLDTIKDMVSEKDTENDTKIVLKQDYYDFRDFAYYGSLTELFRSSVTDILGRFPGELFFSMDNAYYIRKYTVDGELIEETHQIGEDDPDGYVYELKNPFGIDIHSEHRPSDADVLKYFADGGYLNYELVNPCETEAYDFKILPIIVCDDCVVPGQRMDGCCSCASIISFEIVKVENRGRGKGRSKKSKLPEKKDEVKNISIRLYMGNDGKIFYMHNGEWNGWHIRPKHEFLVNFYNNSNAFERLILDFDTTPRYSSTFSVINENEFGYYREFKDFTFPTSEGGYNPTTDESFIDNLVDIGTFYDERFTDNLYRSMTHEAIKNFDWTYTREYEEGEELEYVAGGKKIQKALRIFAREFDEIKTYIDNIRFMSRVTYDERSNLPDYFLADTCEQDGWDIKYVMPYDLKLTKGDEEFESASIEQLFNNEYKHEYTQISKKLVIPYAKENIKDGSENGYFMDCTDGGGFDCWLKDIYGNKIRKAEPLEHKPGSTAYDDCVVDYEEISILNREDNTNRITDRIKSYTDETEYSYMAINNEFLRRLSINSKYIWRHKGTIEGIEMILGMFGLKSKRWLKNMTSMRYKMAENPCNVGKCETAPDYEIKEYTSFAKRIEEEWDVEHQMYRIDWVNTTKTIVYDYRSQSNYTLPGSIGATQIPYQGIPVSYREEYDGYSEDKKYIENYLDDKGNRIYKRYLYPNFDKNEQLDGNPYFQMNGGWIAKKITGGDKEYNFQFDVDDNIVHNQYVPTGTVTENGFINDNRPLYKETIRSIKRVDTLADLVAVPQSDLHDGSIYYVGRIGRDVAVVNGQIYDIVHQGTKKYVRYVLNGGFISVGDKYFDESIVVYNKENVPTTYTLYDKEDGYEIKAYLNSNTDFITYSSDNPEYSITSFQVISDNFEEGDVPYTNYFLLEDVTFSDSIASPGTKDGWRRLKEDDYEYMRINTITNYYEGNNGHNGNMVYDSGHEYFTYFNRIFKHAYDTGQFDSRCYTDGFDWLGGEIFDYGFSGLIESNEEIKQYDRFIKEDTKIHFFGNYKENPDPDGLEMNKPAWERNYDVKNVWVYGDENKFVKSGTTKAFKELWGLFYKGKKWQDVTQPIVTSYMIGSEGSELSIYEKTGDDVTNQILNNKRFKIIFNMKYPFDSYDGQCELKYIDNVVLNYLTQLVPSTAIFDVEYKYCSFNYTGC